MALDPEDNQIKDGLIQERLPLNWHTISHCRRTPDKKQRPMEIQNGWEAILRRTTVGQQVTGRKESSGAPQRELSFARNTAFSLEGHRSWA